jgi:photosystem II stability/assembly factor-like uncharacterized protein
MSSTPTRSPHAALTGAALSDLSFVGTEHGWALATNGAVARTRDGGRTWRRIATLPTPVAQIRFANDTYGYAFAPSDGGGGSFFFTTDGGVSWRSQSGAAAALEILNGTVIRVVDGGGCPPGCTYRVELSRPGSMTWRSVTLPGRPGAGVGATLARTGHDAYLADYANPAGGASSARAVLHISHDDGATWRRRKDPCPTGTGGAELDMRALTTAPDGSVVALCADRAARLNSFVLTSTDHGRTFAAASKTALGAATVSLIGAATAKDVLVMSDQLYRSTDGGGRFGKVVGPHTARFIGFETTSVGRVISGRNRVWTTRDSGSSWTSHRVQ